MELHVHCTSGSSSATYVAWGSGSVNFDKSILSPSQRVSFLGTVINSVQMTATVSAERATMIQRHAAFFKKGTAHPLKAFQKIIPGLMAAASPVLQLGLLRMQPIQFWLKPRVPSTAWRHRITVTRAYISALARWRDLLWLKQGVILDTAHRRKVVTTDASNKGWGAVRRQTDLRSLVGGGVQ